MVLDVQLLYSKEFGIYNGSFSNVELKLRNKVCPG